MQTEIIKPNSLTTILLSTAFYTRLQEQLIWMISNQGTEAVKQANEKILANLELSDEWEYHYYTMLSLVNDIEEAAKAQHNTELIDIPENIGT